MIKKLFDNRYFILFIFPFLIGSLSVLSFQPFNITIINFIIFPLFFYIIVYISKKSQSVYRKKPYKINLFFVSNIFESKINAELKPYSCLSILALAHRTWGLRWSLGRWGWACCELLNRCEECSHWASQVANHCS